MDEIERRRATASLLRDQARRLVKDADDLDEEANQLVLTGMRSAAEATPVDRRTTPAQAMEVVSQNIVHGNQQAFAEILQSKGQA